MQSVKNSTVSASPPHQSASRHTERADQLHSTFLLPLTGDSVGNFRNAHQKDTHIQEIINHTRNTAIQCKSMSALNRGK